MPPVLPSWLLPPNVVAALSAPPAKPVATKPLRTAVNAKGPLDWSQPQAIVLAGNPNVGKSVVFNAITGLYANVSNFPGTTVDIPKGWLDSIHPIEDTPGVYGLSRLSEEETVAEKAIVAADVVINVVNATTLERDLFLTQQLIDYELPLVVALNQADEAKALGVMIDETVLSRLLGVPVVSTVATLHQGIDELKQALPLARVGNPTPGSVDATTTKELETNMASRMQVYGLRRQHVNAILSQVVSQISDKPHTWAQRFGESLGQWLLHPAFGLATLAVVLLALYQMVGIWVAGDLVGFTEETVMMQWIIPPIQKAIGLVVPQTSWVYVFLAGEFGVLTMSLQYIYGVLFPLVLGFYVYISLLEDSGYLPRIAVLSDTLLSRIGLNGRAVIPLILGFGCVTMATVSTRVLTTQRERTIASTILAVTIPCSAQIAVILALMAKAGGLRAWGVYLAFLFLILVALGTALNALLPGKSTPLVLDLPPMRLPSLNNVAKKTWIRTKAFIVEASPLFVLGSAIVGVLQITGLLQKIQVALAPLTVSWLHLPGEAATVFVMGMVRRDFGAAGLLGMANHLTNIQIITALITITLFVPCIASAAVFWKERGLKEATAILFGSWALAFGLGAAISRILEWLPLV
ncbi:MAG: ferrous iron transport protein B [Vampirovibrionales bacterium]|nr:ferrous iron transport protein B [Vampirovibrionales bacterium]